MNREQPVVRIRRRDHVSLGRHQFEPGHGDRRSANEEEKRDHRHVHQANSLVIGGEQPRFQRVFVEVIFLHINGHCAHWAASFEPIDLMYASNLEQIWLADLPLE